MRAVAGYIFFYMLASVGATIFLCTPVARAWDRGVEGQCINVEAFWYANAISNIVGDIATLALPVRMVWMLRMRKGEKVGLYAVFGLGFLWVFSVSFPPSPSFPLSLHHYHHLPRSPRPYKKQSTDR